jgi:hypothetical protein
MKESGLIGADIQRVLAVAALQKLCAACDRNSRVRFAGE